MKEIYVVNCCRTAIGSFGGSLKDTPAADLGAVVMKEALNRAGVKPEQVDEVMFGCILTAGLGQNVARQAALKAGAGKLLIGHFSSRYPDVEVLVNEARNIFPATEAVVEGESYDIRPVMYGAQEQAAQDSAE